MNKSIFYNRSIQMTVVTQLLIILLFIWNGKERLKNFEEHQQRISEQSSFAVSAEVESLISNLQTGLRILITENPGLIARLAGDPENDSLLSKIDQKLKNYFTYFYAVTITDHYGNLFIDDFGEKIGDFCRMDIQLFAEKNPSYGISIHPGPSRYHFDIMVPWEINNDRYRIKKGIFFVSFSTEELVNILNDGETPGHEIYILHREKTNLIEITTNGGREILNGKNFLSNKLIVNRKPIKNTLWEVVDLISYDLRENFINNIVIEYSIIFIGVFILTMLILLAALREEKRRKEAEASLLHINQSLETIVEKRTEEFKKFFSAIEQAADNTIIINKKGIIEYINDAFINTTGFNRDDLIGNKINILKSEHHDNGFYYGMWRKLLSGKSFHAIFTNQHKSGAQFYEDKTISPIKDKNGTITHYIGTGKDISERISHEKEMSYLAHHDTLTDLPNRVLLHDRVEHNIAVANRSGNNVVVMFLNLNRFKAVNDRFGHDSGDTLLKLVARRLIELLREEDTICRNSADEFVILAGKINHNHDIATLAQKIITEIEKPFLIFKNKVSISASIGISIYPANGSSHSELILNASTAMSRAKKNKAGYEFFTESMSKSVLEQLEMEEKLHQALGNNEFSLVYQPKVNSGTRKTVGFEALLRWNNPELGPVSPFKFIPVLEHTGLIIQVGNWIIREVIKQISNNLFQGCCVSINLSPIQCVHNELINSIRTEIEKNNVPPSALEFEITESLFINDFELSHKTLQGLKSLGCSIALDDFGTGYSSLSYLDKLPIDVLKVDRSFIINIHLHAKKQAMLESIMYLTQKLNISTVVEGIETIEELTEIERLGGSIIQGYYFSKPLNNCDVEAWLTNN
ncbi:diguanylate cyclase/phosphodiesterase (GGDEF & EAL domains) with PAS/PAC sensor(s) [hydrothermal vent metagenome]|uniref:Diguanylate cyclase/phosphodiesterase (GGDEF & EAL domains) with PAS/PAC sensor(S) n=1 Tax=hydrothermal vent metagenome TaxID=652676 RepID=A0A3B0WWT5_9ZZZZ